MKKLLGILLGLVIVIVGIIGYRQLKRSGATISDANTVTVGATIFPLADIIQHVGGENVRVIPIIPPGVTEHTSTLTPTQLQQLSKARAVFEIGHGLESHLVERITEAFPSLQVVPVDSGIRLHEFSTEVIHTGEEDEDEESHHDIGTDPHYWLTVPNAITITETVVKNLSEIDPAHAPAYRDNAARYTQELMRLEQELQTEAQGVERKEFIATHNAWSYFANHYGFRLVATYEPVEGKHPSLADLQTLRGVVAQYHLTTFFAEPQKATSAVTEFMRREFGLKILVLDPVGGTAGKESYAALMRVNMEAIVEGAK